MIKALIPKPESSLDLTLERLPDRQHQTCTIGGIESDRWACETLALHPEVQTLLDKDFESVTFVAQGGRIDTEGFHLVLRNGIAWKLREGISPEEAIGDVDCLNVALGRRSLRAAPDELDASLREEALSSGNVVFGSTPTAWPEWDRSAARALESHGLSYAARGDSLMALHLLLLLHGGCPRDLYGLSPLEQGRLRDAEGMLHLKEDGLHSWPAPLRCFFDTTAVLAVKDSSSAGCAL